MIDFAVSVTTNPLSDRYCSSWALSLALTTRASYGPTSPRKMTVTGGWPTGPPLPPVPVLPPAPVLAPSDAPPRWPVDLHVPSVTYCTWYDGWVTCATCVNARSLPTSILLGAASSGSTHEKSLAVPEYWIWM